MKLLPGSLVLLLATFTAAAQTQFHVRDPNASFLDVLARRQSFASAGTPRLRVALAGAKSCANMPPPAPPPKSAVIPPRYFNGSHGPTNPDEYTASEPYYKIQQVAAAGANRYLFTGDPAEAACVIQILLPWARSHALLDYDAREARQNWYQSTWTTASLALAVSVIRAEPTLKSSDRDEVIAWLRAAAKKSLAESTGPVSSLNNHFFWRGLMATATGVISGDDSLFKEGMRTYATAISDIDGQGAFPLEMQRHELSLHYQAFAIEPLVMIAELAMRQGYNVYPLTEDKHQLKDAVDFLHRAIADPSMMKKYAPEPQKMEFDPGSSLLAWLEFWNARFPSTDWSLLLTKPFSNDRLSGSTTLYAAPVNDMATLQPKP